ncbi:MAG: ISAzo13 family transposase [Sulfuritalea sp.]|nr:ISAzo13 family transposase [Sulfuritalea sp.]MDP1984408.1 ISAzo13 family transposase [Sulfuritalea sp.]
MDAQAETAVREKLDLLDPLFDEQTRRLWAAAEAQVIGRSGVSLVARATGLSRTTIHQGIKDLVVLHEANGPERKKRIRAAGGGRKPINEYDPTLRNDLERLVDPVTRGDPESPLRWTCKSTRQLAAALEEQGHVVGRQKVADLLAELGYSLQANRKTKEGSADHPDRDQQFNYINEQATAFQNQKQPVISVDTKKKELVGEFKNAGQEWQPKGDPVQVQGHDFPDPQLGKANPYGVYDQNANVGWVSVGTDHDTSEFAVESIRRWWNNMGRARYPDATELLITADGGGSNGYRVRLWKVALQRFANETGLRISVCHFPPGTSKWNKIEHRMFSYISMNWRGKPLVSHEVIVNLIGSTTTQSGLTISAELDTNIYPKGIRVSDDELEMVNLTKAAFHGEWNYIIAKNCSG